jgi:hypothetical protein
MLPGAAVGWAFGAVADRFGAKGVAVGGLLLAGAASAAAGFTESFAILVALRVLEGVGYTLLVVAATVLIAGHGAIGLSVWSSFAPIGFALGQWAGSHADSGAPLFDVGMAHATALSLAAVALHLFVSDVASKKKEGVSSALRHPPALLSAAAFGGVCAVLLAAVALTPVVLAAATAQPMTHIASLTALAALPAIAGRVAPGWLLERGVRPFAIFVAMSVVAAASIAACLLARLPLGAALVVFAVFQISAGALPGLLSAMMPHVAPTPAQLGTVTGMCSQAVNMGNLIGPPAILAVYAAAGTTAAVAVMVLVLAASLAAIAGLPVFRRSLSQAA